ncbi:aspartic proteinase NANA, chloroplast-like [Prosopis cineraria]|uniref:aspartic proteinase NANA, chloroplast-like n=1 Tax=Prosopis cineraria TaxID=364024 RepID=UPI00240F8E04|nr:aspartic proteinase NANA, chloroplast-like [Prosopis cineraria]
MNSVSDQKLDRMRSTLHWNPFHFSFLFTLILLSASAEGSSSECESDPEPVSLELVHRHDPRVPGNENLKLDKYEAMRERALMDMHRRGLSMVEMPLRTGWEYMISDYYVQVRVGTPPQNFWLIADTGSELTWIRCNDEVTSKNDTRRSALRVDGARAFCRKMSTTYKPLTCADSRCKGEDLVNAGGESECAHPTDYCTYSTTYAHGTMAFGDYGTDVVTLGVKREKMGTIDDMIIGCNHELNFGTDNEGDDFSRTDGMMGLGYTPLSFMYRATKQYGNKFSYCLMEHHLLKNSTNFITFGSYETSQTQKATLSAPMQRTKLMIQPDGEYGIQVEGISIGGQMLQLPAELWDFKAGGGMTLDTGTSLTVVGKPAFQKIGQGLLKALAPKYKTIFGSNETGLRYCFIAEEREGFEKDVPKLGFHFAGGAVFEPPVSNYVLTMKPNVHCLGLLQTQRGSIETAGVIGNIMQQLHLWEYDLASMTVGFAPSQCT